MTKESLRTRSELPWIIAALVVLIVPWYLYNRHVAEFYPEDISEGGAYTVITYGTDRNPARAEQMNIFNRYYEAERLRVELIPGGSDYRSVPTQSAALAAPYILDSFQDEDLRMYAQKGIALPLNEHLKRLRDEQGYDITTRSWAARLDGLRLPNPDWQEGMDPLDRWLWYGVPNNMDIPMVWFNRTHYQQVRQEREARGEAMPPEPWLHWTWWDYAAIARALHRRSPETGRFLSFGGDTPDRDVLYLQVAYSHRGHDSEEFAAMDAEDRRRLGLDGLDWESAIAAWQVDDHNAITLYPNRHALQTVFQFNYDLTHVIRGAPSRSDAEQMAVAGGGFAGGWGNAFKAGTQGMFMTGRWFVGQVRAECGFDWRLLRLPRWVPYEQWQDWQERGLAAEQRDGAWGEQARHEALAAARAAGADDDELLHLKIAPLRGYANRLGGRLSFMSSSTPPEHREQAFRFLEFLLMNEDFNTVLMVEDGMGADEAVARRYLASVDPNFPEEAANRPVAHELGSLENLHPRPRWPVNNHRTNKRDADNAIGTRLSRVALLQDDQAGDPLSYAAFENFFSDEDAIATSRDGIGQLLADHYIDRLQAAYDSGLREEGVQRSFWPQWHVLLCAVLVAGFFMVMAYMTRRDRLRENADV